MTGFSTAWHLHRRLIIVAGAILAGLLALLFATGLVVHLSKGTPGSRAAGTSGAPAMTKTPAAKATSDGSASDVAFWNAQPAIKPAVSTTYPGVPLGQRADPAAYAGAFATELFTRDYAKASREQLLSWTQYEDAPLRSSNYPSSDWTKVLVDSLTDPTWDGATDTPVPAEAVWLALAQDQATTSVSDVVARVDPQWEDRVSDGYEPQDRLTTVWDVSLRITQAGKSGRHLFDVSLALQLGTSPRGMYGVAATNNYVLQEVD